MTTKRHNVTEPKATAKKAGDVSSDMLTIEQVAKRLSCSSKTVRRFNAADRLYAKKVGRLVRVPLGSYLLFLTTLETAS